VYPHDITMNVFFFDDSVTFWTSNDVNKVPVVVVCKCIDPDNATEGGELCVMMSSRRCKIFKS
jgi:hypothetical protein